MERAFATGVGNDVNIYGVGWTDATDVRDVEALPAPYTGRAATKTLLANMARSASRRTTWKRWRSARASRTATRA